MQIVTITICFQLSRFLFSFLLSRIRLETSSKVDEVFEEVSVYPRKTCVQICWTLMQPRCYPSLHPAFSGSCPDEPRSRMAVALKERVTWPQPGLFILLRLLLSEDLQPWCKKAPMTESCLNGRIQRKRRNKAASLCIRKVKTNELLDGYTNDWVARHLINEWMDV